ncbi:uncharacterized protein [Henckelia pumila]|uniref:uncharacterized protein n=1 Tax=Henckelia pumila TaxID=405737 RepID=UPI003C6E9091
MGKVCDRMRRVVLGELRLQKRGEDGDSQFFNRGAFSKMVKAKASELLSLRQGSMSIDEYQHKFFEMFPYCPQISCSTEAKYNLFLQGLNPKIHDRVSVGDDMTYEGLVSQYLQAEDSIHRNRSGGVMHFGRKGQCNYCGKNHPSDKCHKAAEAFFGCVEIDHMKKDCPQAGELVLDLRSPYNRDHQGNLQEYALSKRLLLGFTLEFEGNVLSANLMVLAIEDFNCILGIDMLTTYRASVGCYQKLVQFHPVGGDNWFFYGETARPPMLLVSALKACRDLKSGGKDYLIYAIDFSTESIGIEDLPVVNEFPDVFLHEIPGFSPVREVEFGIELMLGTSSISREPYHLAPSEMRELKNQLQDLLDKGYIRPRAVNLTADSLSHKVRVSSLQTCLVSSIRDAQMSNPKTQRLARLSKDDSMSKFHYEVDGFLCLSGRIVALYDRRCRTPLFWEEVGERQVEGPELVQRDADIVDQIRKRFRTAQDCQSSYENTKRRPLILRFGLKRKLSPRFIGPFEILESVGDLVYIQVLPPYLSSIHDVFHVSLLKRYVADEPHIFQPSKVQLDTYLTDMERPLRIMGHKDKVLHNKIIPLVLFQWKRRGTEEATWELESCMRLEHPELF